MVPPGFRKFFSGLISAFLLDRAELWATEKPPIILGEGEQRIIRIAGLERYSLGSDHVRALIPPARKLKHGPLARNSVDQEGSSTRPLRSDEIMLKGVRRGTTDLWVWKIAGATEHRTVQVRSLGAKERNAHIEQAVSILTDTELIYTGRGIVLRGCLKSWDELSRVAALVREYPQELHDETSPTEALLQSGEHNLRTWLRRSGLANHLRVERLGSSVWLRGSLERPVDRATLVAQARAQFPAVEIDLEALSDFKPTIHFRVYLLELKKSHFRRLGLGPPSALPQAFVVHAQGVQTALQLDLTLHQLEEEGNAHILSNPELVVRAPGEAELFAGGELPIQLQNRFVSNVSWKPYGLTLKLHVEQATAERVRLEISTEVSHLDRRSNAEGIPGVQSNRMKTQVDAPLGKPLLLAGLLQKIHRQEAQGLPFLRAIPVLGLLFGSEDYLLERSELVAVLLPNGTPPPYPTRRLQDYLPMGPLPPPTSWLSPAEERAIRQDPHYPWNALE